MIAQPSSRDFIARAAGAQAVGHRLDAVALLHAQLLRAADDALAARMRGEQRDERELVDEQRHLLRASTSVATSSACCDLHVADGLAASACAVEDGDARAHALEHVEQAGAARVERRRRGR